MNKIRDVLLQYPQIKKKNKRADNKKPRVIVAGRTYNSNLAMARSLGEAGYEVEVLRVFLPKPSNRLKTFLAPEAYCKYVKAFYVCVSDGNTKSIKEYLLTLTDMQKKLLIIPTDDCLAAVLEEYYDELQEYFFLPNINATAGEILKLMRKETQKTIAKDAGFSVASSCLIEVRDGQFTIPDEIKYPCIIKPNSSKDGVKNNIQVCHTELELNQVLKTIAAKGNIDMLVEDFIFVRKEYSLLGLSTSEGVIVPGGFVVEASGHNERCGVTLLGKIGQNIINKEAINNAIKLVEKINYEGLFDIDLIESEDKTIYFVELNLRYGGSGYALTQSGVNLPGMYADYIFFNTPIDKACEIKCSGKTFLNERVLLDEYRSGYITRSEVKTYMKNVDIFFIKNKEDMRPYYFFKVFFIFAFLKNTYLKLKAYTRK